MSNQPNLIRILSAALLAALAVSACSGEAGDSDALDVLNQADQITGFASFENGSDKTFGLFTCVSGDEVTLLTVEPLAIEGEIEFLGALTFDVSNNFVGAVDGFPPTGLDSALTEPFDGSVVTVPCEDADPEVKTQILLGANRTGPGGGKIEGIRITHSEGSLDVPDYTIILCGDDDEYCESLRTPEE